MGRSRSMGRRPISVPRQPVALTVRAELDRDPRWALIEGSRHFEEKARSSTPCHEDRAASEGLGIPFAVVVRHGPCSARPPSLHRGRRYPRHRGRFEDIHDRLEGLGYLPRPAQQAPPRHGTRGQDRVPHDRGIPGRREPRPSRSRTRPVSFEADGVNYIKPPNLIELKLASGMTNPGRSKDLPTCLELDQGPEPPRGFRRPVEPLSSASQYDFGNSRIAAKEPTSARFQATTRQAP